MEFMALAGAALLLIGGLGFLLTAFRTGILWGLAVIFIPPASIVFLVMHWQSAKGAFKLQLLGLAIVLVAVYLSHGSVNMNNVKSSVPGFSASSSQSFNQTQVSSQPVPWQNAQPAVAYRCDGRVHCSQMTSCEEATFFLRNCPGTKMDGDGNGIPCERQWCRR